MDRTASISNISITDLPNEILEMIVPDHTPQTISTMKLVNRRFYHLLSYDRYYKDYLLYPEKIFLSAIKNEKSSGKEVIDDIKSGAVGKWEGYLKVERHYLKNWKCGKVTSCDIVPLPSQGQTTEVDRLQIFKWQELIDEDGEHWLLSLRDDGAIVLLNITNKPKVFIERDILTQSVILLHGQVLCRSLSLNKSSITVLDITKSGDEISLQYNFTFDLVFDFDEDFGHWCVVTSNKRNIFVNVDRGIFNGLLHFRDLKSGNMLEDACLWDYECLNDFRKRSVKNELELRELNAFFLCKKTEHPYLILILRVETRRLLFKSSVIVVFNVENMEAVTFVNITQESVHGCYISSKFLYILTRMDIGSFYHLHGISLEKHTSNDILTTPKLVYSYYDKIVNFPTASSVNGKLYLIGHLCWYRIETVRIVDISDGVVNQVLEVTLDGIDCCNSSFYMIRPGFLVVYPPKYGIEEQVRIFKLTTDENCVVAKELIDWFKTFVDSKINLFNPTPVSDSKDLSKLVCYDADVTGNSDLVILYF